MTGKLGTMRLLLVRHGEAVDPAEARTDGLRWLTPRGRIAVHRLAGRLAERGVLPRRLWTSPLVRAVQTAEVLAGAAHAGGLAPEVRVASALAPDEGSSADLLDLLLTGADEEPVALVGHEPSIRIFAGHLLRSAREPAFHTAEAWLLQFDATAQRAELLARLGAGP